MASRKAVEASLSSCGVGECGSNSRIKWKLPKKNDVIKCKNKTKTNNCLKRTCTLNVSKFGFGEEAVSLNVTASGFRNGLIKGEVGERKEPDCFWDLLDRCVVRLGAFGA